ncbi:helix-turn-helix domain-containing protein [Kaistella carnis]|nr:helix-turn-helix domain-containing protein [Kaistella carnis]
MMNHIQFIGVSPNDLIEKIKEQLIPAIKKELSEEFQPKQPTEYLTRSQVCEMLKIDLSTLHRWRKEGALKSYGIGNRVYFKRSEIDHLMNENEL